MEKSHKRSNVESTFIAVKRKFGDSVRNRNPAAMVNEVLAKFVCHNISRVIHWQCDVGIEADFWANTTGKEAPMSLPISQAINRCDT